jgi:putative endonuclease
MTRPGVRIPIPPVYARSVAESVDCRAVALAKADLFYLATLTQRATTRHATRMGSFTYVYILQSETDPTRFYTGCTQDLRKRLGRHNIGEVRHTTKWKPWRIKTYVAFSDRALAKNFESYLKSASGRAFLKKRL